MRISSALAALLLFFALALAVPANLKRSATIEDLIRIRCSTNPDQETYFFFNGTVTAYLGRDTGGTYMSPTANPSIVTLFNAVGINVAKCYKSKTGAWYLVGREAMWYVDSSTDQILSSWSNTKIGANTPVNVVHVDNDPVMQTFSPAQMRIANDQTPIFPVQVYGDDTILPSDVTGQLNYQSPLWNDARFADYAPYQYYQAAELFKFFAPTNEAFSDLETVSRSAVSWTRTSKFLPWMKMGNTAGYLLYSFQGSKIPDYTYLPAQIKADIENRVPHYKHAPDSKCYPDLTGTVHGASGVTSWSFFLENFDAYLAGTKFPLATKRSYGCKTDAAGTYEPAEETACKATITLNTVTAWSSGSQTITQYDMKITNAGTKPLKTLAINIAGASVVNSWNIAREGNTNVYDVNLWTNLAVGGSVSGAYGIQVTGTPVVSAASVTCA